MRTSDVLVPLLDAGLSVQLVDGKVRVTPVESLTDELRQHIYRHKPELLALLSGGSIVWLAQSTWPDEDHRFADAERWAMTDREHATRFPEYTSCLAHCRERGLYRPVAINE